MRSLSWDRLFYNVSLSIHGRITRCSCSYIPLNHVFYKYIFIASRVSDSTICIKACGHDESSRDKPTINAQTEESSVICQSKELKIGSEWFTD